MKSTVKVMFIAMILAGSVAAIGKPDPQESKVVSKAREAVMQAKPYDWEVLAESAKTCFRRNENATEALAWIDKSIEINENPVNLEIKGDYLQSIGKKEEAVRCYYQAIVKGKEQNFLFDTQGLQDKIWKLR